MSLYKHIKFSFKSISSYKINYTSQPEYFSIAFNSLIIKENKNFSITTVEKFLKKVPRKKNR